MTDDSGSFRRIEDRERLIQLGEAVNHMSRNMDEVKATLKDIRESLNGVQVMQSEVVELKSQNIEYRNKLQDHEVRFGQIRLVGWIFTVCIGLSTSMAGWAWTQLSGLQTADKALGDRVLTLELKQDNMNVILNLKQNPDASSAPSPKK